MTCSDLSSRYNQPIRNTETNWWCQQKMIMQVKKYIKLMSRWQDFPSSFIMIANAVQKLWGLKLSTRKPSLYRIKLVNHTLQIWASKSLWLLLFESSYLFFVWKTNLCWHFWIWQIFPTQKGLMVLKIKRSYLKYAISFGNLIILHLAVIIREMSSYQYTKNIAQLRRHWRHSTILKTSNKGMQ